jgi:hypothetical protein
MIQPQLCQYMKTAAQILLSVFAGTLMAQTPVQFVNPIPSGFNPAVQVSQWAEVSPNYTLPSGHCYVLPPNKQGWTMSLINSKGVTHWTRNSVGDEGGNDVFLADPYFAKKGYNGVPRIREIFGLSGPPWWPNGFYNEAQARQKAQQSDIRYRLWVGETMEGEDYVPEGDPMWGWFYDELINRYEAQKAADGVPYFVAHNYFSRWPGIYNLGHDTQVNHESLYNTPWQNWPATHFHPGHSLGRPNAIVEGIYVNAPDLAPQQMLQAIMHMELADKMGKVPGLFLFAVHEWHPGFAKRYIFPEGTLYRSDKTPLDPNLHIALAFLAHEYGKIFIEWGAGGYQSATMKPVDYYPSVHDGKDYWYPLGSSTVQNPCPFYAQSGPNRYTGGGGDLTHFGVALWAATGAQVEGGTPYYATYRIDGGSWIQRTSNGSDLVSAYFGNRGVTRVRILGNKMLICYFNLKYADNQPHSIEVQNPLNPAQTFTGTVCGNGVHAVVVSL